MLFRTEIVDTYYYNKSSKNFMMRNAIFKSQVMFITHVVNCSEAADRNREWRAWNPENQ